MLTPVPACLMGHVVRNLSIYVLLGFLSPDMRRGAPWTINRSLQNNLARRSVPIPRNARPEHSTSS